MSETTKPCCGNCRHAEWAGTVGQCRVPLVLPSCVKVERWCVFRGDKGCKLWEQVERAKE